MSSVNGSSQYGSPAAFRRALEDRLKRESKARGRLLEQLRREFLFQRFLALLFSHPDPRWVLKGGGSLLVRLADARSSRDLDLLRLDGLDPQQSVAELRALTAPRAGDFLTFTIGDPVTFSRRNPVVELSVDAYVAGPYGGFPIDLATELHLVAAPERVRPAAVVEVPGLGELPEMILYPLPDQVADKVCAMYEGYGQAGSPSSRFRDLVDLVLIVSTCQLDAAQLVAALRAESARRGLTLPVSMVAPGPAWPAGYQAYARKTRLDAALHDLTAALEHVGVCLNPLLDGGRTSGEWTLGSGWA